MNEELKIIIKAVTSSAKKGIQDIKKELEGVSKEAKGASGGFSSAMKGFGKAAAAAIAAIAAIGVAIVALGKKTLELQKTQAKLNTAFQSVGASAQQAAESYKELFRFLGDNDKSVEAASHLAKLTTNQQELAEWAKICQGIYASFGDSLPIEGLTEAANETARVGKVTGTLADALNWAGVSEDEFNAKLAKTVSYEEREALIRNTLNGLYSNAADIYEKNNKTLLEHNESQAKLNQSLLAAGSVVTPLLTALNNLSSALLDALKPALDVIVPAIATVVNWLVQGIQAVMAFFGAITGSSMSVSTFAEVGSGIGNAAGAAGELTSGLESAGKAAEAVKRATMGFDELNVVPSGSAGGGGGGGSPGPGYMTPVIDASKFIVEVEETENTASGLVKIMQEAAATLAEVFGPTISAWSDAFDQLVGAWERAKPHFVNGAKDIWNAFAELGSYVVGTFVPDLVNSFSTNLAPVIADVFSFSLESAGKDFELFGSIINDATSALIIPALESIKTVLEDIFEYIGTAWSKHGQTMIANATKVTEHIRKVISELYEQFLKPIIETLTETFNSVWENGLGPAVEKAIESIMELGSSLLELYNVCLAPMIDWLMANVVPWFTAYVQQLLETIGTIVSYLFNAVGGVIDSLSGLIQFITGVFTGDWDKAWEGIKKIFSGIWDSIVNIAAAAWEWIKYPFTLAGQFFEDVWGQIQNAFSSAEDWFSGVFEGAWNGIKDAWSGVKNWFSGVWDGIKSVFGNISSWFKDKFSAAWTAVKNVFSSGGKIFDGIKDGILNGLKAVVNGIITGINKVIAVPFNGLNSVLSKIRNVEIVGIRPFDWVGTLSVPQIPKLARGGIIDQATLALIGERGKEAVVPLENNTEWIDKLVDRLTARDSSTSRIVLMLDGKELGWATINSINNITRQTGGLQLTLV